MLSRIRVRVEEEPFGTDLVPNYSNTKVVTLGIRVGGESYQSFSCNKEDDGEESDCEPETIVVLNDWTYFEDTSKWFREDGGNSEVVVVGDDGFVPGSRMELKIFVEDGADYVWSDIDASKWGTGAAQAGYQTDSIQNVNGNGPFMRWEFDVYPIL